ncbi:MAG: hypothetical protein GX207_03415 [Peptococcaceae bacterium]|nr:hypothetical protein [Peptococcaceae bacterium]
MYKKSFLGYGKKSVEEAVAELEKKYDLELREVNKEIEEAMKEHKEFYDRFSKMMVEYKRLKEQTGQFKQLKEYMPIILSHKKMSMEKEVNELKRDTEEYIHNVKKHCLLIEEEINKVKQKIQVFVNSLSQLFVLRDVKEFEDLIRHFDQVLEEYRLRDNLDSGMVPEDLLFNNDNEEEELESLKEYLVSDNDSDSLLVSNNDSDSLLVSNNDSDSLLVSNNDSLIGHTETLDHTGHAGHKSAAKEDQHNGKSQEPSVSEKQNYILREITPSKIAASVTDSQQNFNNEKIIPQNNVNFPVQDDEVDELTQLLKQLI